MRSISSAVALAAAVVAGCAREPTAPRPDVVVELPPAAVAAKASVSANPTIAIDDALNRVLGALDEETATSLKGPLTAVKATLKSRDLAALQGAILIARQALTAPAAANDERAPDLAAIALALDAAAAAK